MPTLFVERRCMVRNVYHLLLVYHRRGAQSALKICFSTFNNCGFVFCTVVWQSAKMANKCSKL